MIISGGGGGAYTYYTPEERTIAIEELWEMPPEEFEIRVEEQLEIYIESDIHFTAVQRRLNVIITKYSNVTFDNVSMAEEANTIEKVRTKFSNLNALNLNLETAAVESGGYISPSHAVWAHYEYLANFMYEYINALESGIYIRNTELALILELKRILYRELGFTENFLEHMSMGAVQVSGFVGKGIGNVTGFITESIISPIAAGFLEGILGKDWKRKLVIGIVIIIIVVIIALIGLYYGKSYIGAKAVKKAIA